MIIGKGSVLVSDLDEKLKTILLEDYGVVDVEESIAKTKQVFIDEGWRHTRGVKEGRLMSGQEFYDKVQEEYAKLRKATGNNAVDIAENMLKAVEIASGYGTIEKEQETPNEEPNGLRENS